MNTKPCNFAKISKKSIFDSQKGKYLQLYLPNDIYEL